MTDGLLGANRLVIAGGTGFLGQSLARYLTRRGSEVVVLGRHQPTGDAAGRPVVWDARTLGAWTRELDGADALVNLVGRSVDCIKTPDHCDEILRSRVESTALLGRALQVITPPRVWVQMSTAHIYGDPPEVVCDEDSAFGYGLAPSVGQAWLDDERMSGAYVATAPNPVSNAVFMRELRRTLKVPIGLPARSWMVRIAAPLLALRDLYASGGSSHQPVSGV